MVISRCIMWFFSLKFLSDFFGLYKNFPFLMLYYLEPFYDAVAYWVPNFCFIFCIANPARNRIILFLFQWVFCRFWHDLIININIFEFKTFNSWYTICKAVGEKKSCWVPFNLNGGGQFLGRAGEMGERKERGRGWPMVYSLKKSECNCALYSNITVDSN